MDYRSYRRTNPAYLTCIIVCSVDIACYQVSRAGDLSICGLSTYGRTNPALSHLFHCIQSRHYMLPGISSWRLGYLWIIDRTGGQMLLYLTCIIVSFIDIAHYQVNVLEIWVFVVYRPFRRTNPAPSHLYNCI